MAVNVMWYQVGRSVIYEIEDAPTLDEIKHGLTQLHALIAGHDALIDVIFDYRTLADNLPTGTLGMIQQTALMFPTLNRIALVGDNKMVEMIMREIAQISHRSAPTTHLTVEAAAKRLGELAANDVLSGI